MYCFSKAHIFSLSLFVFVFVSVSVSSYVTGAKDFQCNIDADAAAAAVDVISF